MGTYLSTPNTAKHSESGKYDLRSEPDGKNLPFAVSEMQGWRKTMEDAHITMANLENHYDVPPGTSLFAVFDGHAGKEVASFCGKHFVEQLVELESFKAGAYREALVECFHRMDDLLRDPRYRAEINDMKHIASRPIPPPEMKIETEDEKEYSDNSNPNGPNGSTEERKTSSGSGSTGSKTSNISMLEDIDDEVDLSFDEETETDDNDKEGKPKPKGSMKETSSSPRAESMNLNYLKNTLKEAVMSGSGPNGETIKGSSEAAGDSEGAKTGSENGGEGQVDKKKNDSAGSPNNGNNSLQARMQNAEAKGTISKNEAFELMMQVLKLQRNGNNSKGNNANAGSNSEEENSSSEQTPEKYDFDDDSVASSVFDFPTVAGCTAIVILVVNQRLYTANAGDSRAVLCRNLTSLALSFDHKPNNEKEKSRIEAAGGFVNEVGRVCGNLNLSRSIGDLKYKTNDSIPRAAQIITAEPDVTINELTNYDLFFVLACDGVWDILTNDAIVEFINNELLKQAKGFQGKGSNVTAKIDTKKIVENIFDRCISVDPLQTQGLGGDNMTCLVVFLKPVEEVLQILTAKNK